MRMVSEGLRRLAKERDVILSQGEGLKAVNAVSTLAVAAIDRGLNIDKGLYRGFVERVFQDHGAASKAIQEAFFLATGGGRIPWSEGADQPSTWSI